MIPIVPSQLRIFRDVSEMLQGALNNFKDGDFTPSMDNLFQYFTILTVKYTFYMFKCNFLCISICLLPPVLSLGTKFTPSSWPLPIKYFHRWIKFLHLFFSSQRSPSSLSLSIPRRSSSPFILLAALHWSSSGKDIPSLHGELRA